MRQPHTSNAGPSARRHAEDHEQREEQADRRRGLDPARERAALAFRRVLGDVGRRAAVLAAEREALQHAHADQDDRRRDPDRRVRGQHADDRGRAAHDEDGDEEGVLAADEVAEAAEDDRAERAHREAGREREQREDERARLVQRGEELLADDRGERAVQVEVVPLEDRPEGRREDDLLLLLRDAHARGGGGWGGLGCALRSGRNRGGHAVLLAGYSGCGALPHFQDKSPSIRHRTIARVARNDTQGLRTQAVHYASHPGRQEGAWLFTLGKSA